MTSSRDRIKHFLDSTAIQSDCTPKCRSKMHRKMCRDAIMNKSCSDEYLAAYLLYACQNFYKNCCNQGSTSSDKFQNGDNILHWICSSSSVSSKSNLLAWILENFGSQDEILNARDVESGYTPLHKSILYGNLACSQVLLKHGAAINVKDFDGLTAIDLLIANTNTVFSDKSAQNFLYGCGENVSYNLGHSLPIRKSQFDVIDFPSSSCVKQISMSNYHTLFLTKNGSILACGHGACGRLGLGDENAQIVPKLIETVVLASNAELQTQTTTPSSKIQFSFVSASNNHSLAVSVDGDAYSWGDNSHRSLGHSANPNDKELRPRLIHFPKNFKNTCQFVGCAASNFASVLWSHNAIYTFGENLGHLGHSKQDGQFLHFPRKVIMSTIQSVEFVTMNNNVTAIVAAKGDVFVLQNFECKKIANRILDLKTVRLFPDDSPMTMATTKLLILTTSGKLYFWQTGDPVLTRVVFLGVPRMIYPVHFACSSDFVYLTAPNGDFFFGDWLKIVKQQNTNKSNVAISPTKLQDQFQSLQVRNTKNQQLKLEHDNSYKESLKSFAKPRNAGGSYFQCQKPNLLDYSSCVRLQIRRRWNIFGAQWSACSPDGQNTLVFVQQPSVPIAQMSEISSDRHSRSLLNDFSRFYEELDEESADLIIECGNVKFPAHKFILASRSKYFAEKLKCDSKVNFIKAPEGLSANVFGQALRSIYFTELQNQVLQQTKSTNSKAVNKLNAGATSAVNSALKTLQVDSFDDGFSFDAHQWPELVDISLICVDGQELPCHRCVLCPRVDYFRCMFASHWMEASINQAKFKVNADFRVAKILLQYIYQDRIDEISQCKPDEDEQDFLNLLCKLLAAADEWLLDGLKRLCEKELCKLVSLKNCLELLQLAKTYNAENLHKCCRIFACLNICSLITSSQFINLDAHLVTKLEETYKNGGFNVVCSPVKTFDNRAVVEAVETAFITLKSCDIDDEDLDVLCREYAKRTTNIVAVIDQSDLNKSLKKANAEIVSKTQSPVSPSKAINLPTPDRDDSSSSTRQKIERKNSPIENDGLQSPDFSDEKPILSIAEKSRAKRMAGWFEPSSPTPDASFSMVSLRDVMNFEEKMQLEAETKKKEIIKKATPPPTPVVKKGWNISAANSHQSPSSANFPSLAILADKPPASNPIPIFPSKTPPPSSSTKKTLRSPPAAASKLYTPQSTVSAERPAATFLAVSPSLSEIIRDEESSFIHRREILNKPLKFIQIEEQALQELRIAYDADNNFDENITVERFFEGRVAEPYWQAHVAESL